MVNQNQLWFYQKYISLKYESTLLLTVSYIQVVQIGLNYVYIKMNFWGGGLIKIAYLESYFDHSHAARPKHVLQITMGIMGVVPNWVYRAQIR